MDESARSHRSVTARSLVYKSFLATTAMLCYPEYHFDTRMANRAEKAVDGQPGEEIGDIASAANLLAYKHQASRLMHIHNYQQTHADGEFLGPRVGAR